jgi:hypothetical protein
MNNQTRTVQEFLNRHRMEGINGKYLPKNVEYLLVKFARLHVEAALQAAANEVRDTPEPPEITRQAILLSYSLENIK